MEEQLRDGQAPDADITEEMIAACRGRAAFMIWEAAEETAGKRTGGEWT